MLLESEWYKFRGSGLGPGVMAWGFGLCRIPSTDLLRMKPPKYRKTEATDMNKATASQASTVSLRGSLIGLRH